MTHKNDNVDLAPTIRLIVEQFTAAMRADDAIDNNTIDRLEKLLLLGNIPNLDEIKTALFNPPMDGNT